MTLLFWLVGFALDGHISLYSHFSQDMKQDCYQIQIVPLAICFIIFGARMSILLVIRLKILVLVKWSYKSPPSNYVDYWT